MAAQHPRNRHAAVHHAPAPLMANGRTHAAASLTAAPFGMMQCPTDAAGFAFAAGCLTAMVLTPDLDLLDSSGMYSQYIIRETFGRAAPVVERAFFWYWYPYSRALSHRAFLSHFPVVGSLVRLAYAAPFTGLVWGILGHDMAYFVVAVIACDAAHWVMDWRVWGWLGVFRQ